MLLPDWPAAFCVGCASNEGNSCWNLRSRKVGCVAAAAAAAGAATGIGAGDWAGVGCLTAAFGVSPLHPGTVAAAVVTADGGCCCWAGVGDEEESGVVPLSDFRLGKLTGCGARRALGTLPKLCMPCLGATALACGSIEFPFVLQIKTKEIQMISCIPKSDFNNNNVINEKTEPRIY